MSVLRSSVSAATLMLAAACTTNSAVDTGETASKPSEAQVAGFHVSPPITVNPYLKKRSAPQMGRDGCATSVRKERGALVIPEIHPDEVYCIKIAALSNTTLELPPGARLQSASTAMLRYVQIESANTVERDVVLLTSKCVPPRRDEAGVLQPSEVHEFVDQSSLPYCPRPTAEITIVLSTGVVQLRATLNSQTHDARVIMDEDVSDERIVGIPVKPNMAQDLYATAKGDEVIPWVPDDAWADAVRTVIVWHRPMPVLPAMMLGSDGEQRAAPRVVVNEGAVALVYPERVTRFQLRMDDRTLAFSDAKPKSLIQPAGALR